MARKSNKTVVITAAQRGVSQAREWLSDENNAAATDAEVKSAADMSGSWEATASDRTAHSEAFYVEVIRLAPVA